MFRVRLPATGGSLHPGLDAAPVPARPRRRRLHRAVATARTRRPPHRARAV